VGSGVGSPDADVVQAAGVAEGDHAGGVDPVAANPVVGVGVPAGRRGGLRPRGVDGGGGGPLRAATGAGAAGYRRRRTRRGGSVAGRSWWAGRVGRPATSSSSAGTARPCRRWSGGWGGSSSAPRPGGAAGPRTRCGRRGHRSSGWCRPSHYRSTWTRGCRAELRLRRLPRATCSRSVLHLPTAPSADRRSHRGVDEAGAAEPSNMEAR
jgi:hypothetical protein